MEPIRTVQFVLRQKTDIDFVLELLRRDYSLHETGQMHFMRHFLDSFDWRLYRKNYLCGWDESINTSRSSSNREGVFFIHDKETDDNVCEFPLNHIPRFSREIAHPACRKLLDDILDVRALMTVAAVIIKARHLFVLNEDNKTLLMLQVENYTIQRQAGEEQLPGRLLVCPIKGYIKTFRQVIRTITKNLKLSRASKALIDDVFAVIGQKADSDRFVVIRKLTDSLNTWEAVQILLRHLLSVMQANEPGLRDAIDTEFLHDYRVAVRRARSMLGQIKHILPDKLLVYFKRELLWLGTITTPTRDLDIYLLKFDRYKQELPVELQRDLEPFRLFLERHWKIEHACLCKALGSNRYHRLIGKWQKILASENIRSEDTLLRDTPQTEMFNATKPVRQVASQRIWKLYKRVLKEGRAVTPQSHDQDLHELRKTCKKFRYLIEFFHDYYPDKQIKKRLRTLKQLQDNLGDFQDLCVQLEQLKRFAQQMQQEGVAGTKTIMAMGVLVEKLNARKASVRAEFSQRFKVFSQQKEKSAFVRAFSPH